VNLPRPSAKTATTPADLAAWLAAAYDVLLPLSADAISPARIPALLAITMPTLDELRATRGDPEGLTGPRACILAGKVEPLDGSEGVFIWDVTSIAVDDDGETTVESPAAGVPDGAPGRWRRHTPQIPPPPQADIQEFAEGGTWVKPAVVNGYSPRWVRVELVPWGASGAGGDGGGGGASGVGAFECPASLLGASEVLTFGTQPTGGTGGFSGGAGNDGTDAPDATFGVWLRVKGGKKGTGAGVGGAGGYGNMGTGGNGGNTGVAGAAGTGRAAGGGGGSNAAGGNGGPDRATTLTGGAAGGPGATGTAGADGAVGETGGGGGGGGGGNTGGGTAGGAGANGGRYGAGGGAGGASSFGFFGGTGGNGGPCFGRVTTWY